MKYLSELLCTNRVLPKKNYLLEGGPLVVQASLARWGFSEPLCSHVPAGVVMRGCVLLQGNFFEHSLSESVHFTMGDLWAHLPTVCWDFHSFRPKTAWPPCLTPPIHQILPQVALFVCFPRWKKSSKGNVLLTWKGKTEGRSTKMHRNWQAQKNCFEQWKKTTW